MLLLFFSFFLFCVCVSTTVGKRITIIVGLVQTFISMRKW